MSGRSSLPSIAIALAIAGCADKVPEADPAKVAPLAQVMIKNIPPPAGARDCTVGDLHATPLTARALFQLGAEPLPDKVPEYDAWVNPAELDAPAVRVLVDKAASETDRRRAAAALLGSKTFIVYKVEMVNVPIALGIKELKRGALGMRAIGYDAKGNATCLLVFTVQNDKAVSEWAMDKSDKALIDPAIAKAVRDDLSKQLQARIAGFLAQ
jgi:hypothetical protein